jgi:hypothetical protein
MNIQPDGVQVTVNGQVLMVYRCGDVFRLKKSSDWRFIENTANCNEGYNRVRCCKKMYSRHRIVAYAYLNLDIDDTTQQIDHINGNKLCNHVDNLRIVNNQENCHNRTTAKGYYWNKRDKKWQAQIMINYKLIHLGCFDNEDDARLAYLNAKLIYHPSCPIYDK